MIFNRTVHPDVHKSCGRSRHAPQVSAAHDAIGGAIGPEKRENILVLPAGMAKLHGDSHPLRKRLQEIGQPGIVPGVCRRKLD
jgi:hypothetical protein